MPTQSPHPPQPMMLEDVVSEAWRITPCRVAERLTAGKFKRYAHIKFISRKIAQAVARGGARIVLSVPPRHGKSWLTSLFTPAWFLSLYPGRRVILASYEADFAAEWGRQVRNLITEHSGLLGVSLSDDSTAANRWNTPDGGGMVTAGVGGPITGRGGDLLIVDDPVKNWEDAMSEVYREKAINWFNSTLYTRAEPGASIIVLMTRWHERDLAGYLEHEHEEDWEVIRIPALAEDGDILGRKLGQALCPERYDNESLDKIRRAVGARVWNALYQQRPSPGEGGELKRQWWQTWNALPDRFDETLISADLTFGDKDNSDYCVFQAWGKRGASKYLLDQVRERLDFPGQLAAFKAFCAKHKRIMTKVVEEKANGAALIATVKNEIAGVIPFNPKTGKDVRVQAVSPEIEAGNVYLPSVATHPWVADFIEEAAAFPRGAHDDQVDAMTQALLRWQALAVGEFTEEMAKPQGNVIAPSLGSTLW